MELSVEQSENQAEIIKIITIKSSELDVEYLEECLKKMRANHSTREAAAVMNPRPFIHHEQQDVHAAKLEHLQAMIDLAKTYKKIRLAEIALGNAKQNESQMGKLFGGV